MATRAKPSAMCTPTRSWRQITGRMPTAAAASMIGVVGKQNRVEIPSRFRISAMTCITCIGCSSRLMELGSAFCRTCDGAASEAEFDCPPHRASTDHPACVGATQIASGLVADLDARSDVAGVLHDAGAAARPGRLGNGRCRLRRGAGATGENRGPTDHYKRKTPIARGWRGLLRFVKATRPPLKRPCVFTAFGRRHARRHPIRPSPARRGAAPAAVRR